jgi:hypothetical protein
VLARKVLLSHEPHPSPILTSKIYCKMSVPLLINSNLNKIMWMVFRQAC